VIFEDETGFTEHPRVSRGWARRAEPFRVPTASNHRRRLNVFGGVAPREGQHGLMRAPRGNTPGFLALLSRRRRRGKVLYLFVDRARGHRGPQVKNYLAAHRQIHLEYLPPCQSGLNAQERIGRQLRYERTNNHWFADLDQAWRAIRETTRRWSTQKIPHLCNIS
jgi:hypothetical protein